MIWAETFTMYETSKYMVEFINYLWKQAEHKDQPKISLIYWLKSADIRDVFAWLQCYAEKEQLEVYIICKYYEEMADVVGIVGGEFRQFNKIEKAMEWCAEKVFQLIKK